MQLLAQIGLVALGSALGGLLRWGIGLGFGSLLGTRFPWGTLFINISGSLFLGWFTSVVQDRLAASGAYWLSNDSLKLFLAVGFTGAYTTFSTYEYESYSLLRDGDNLLGWLYMLGSLFLGLAAVRLGVIIAKGD